DRGRRAEAGVSVVFTRGDQSPKWLPAPCTWDYAPMVCEDGTPLPKALVGDLAHATCSNRHTGRVSPSVHSVAADGTLSPSYVCPVPGCSFHEFVRFEGWKR